MQAFDSDKGRGWGKKANVRSGAPKNTDFFRFSMVSDRRDKRVALSANLMACQKGLFDIKWMTFSSNGRVK